MIIRNRGNQDKDRFRIKYLLSSDAYSLAVNYFIFSLILVWVIIDNFATTPLWQSITLSIFALYAICMWVMFTFFMFFPEKMSNLRKSLEHPFPSDSKTKKFFRLVFPWSLWVILFITFLAGLVQGANQMQANIRNIVVLVGAIWLIVVPLLSLVKLSFIDKKGYQIFKVPKLALHLRGIKSRALVILLAVLSVIAVIIYYLVTQDSSLWMNIVASASVFLVGLALIYLIVEQRINEERRARQRPVEHSVLEGILSHAIAIVRVIGIYAAQDDLEVATPLENNEEIIKKTESFAKKVIGQGLQLPQSSFQKESAVTFSRLLDDLLEKLFLLQGRYPFVIEEYPDIATILSNLESRQSSIKSAFYWAFLDTKTNASEHEQLVESRLVEVIKICDELAETTSKYLELIANR